jgi:hypothetical protein
MFPLVNGLFTSFLEVNNKFPNSMGFNQDKTKNIQLYLSNQNSALSSQFINMFANSPNLFSNIYTKEVLTQLSEQISKNIQLPIRKVITEILTNTTNFIDGYDNSKGTHIKGIMEIVYPNTGDVIDFNKLLRDEVKELFEPLKHPTFM